jgi:8-oxo-dGTP pyrophosphatase MutT (NUDIX family)
MAEEAQAPLGSQEPVESREDLSLIARLKERLAVRERVLLHHEAPELRRAAVLAPIVFRGGEPALVFTQRSANLTSHKGQISFPGGRCDDGDADLAATALRESFEEIGLDPASVEILGLLDEIPTPSGYVITPVVGLVHPAPERYAANPHEVDEVFEVSLAKLADPAVFHDMGVVERWGRRFQLSSYQVDGRNIWGATARMVYVLLDLVR